MVVTPTLGTVVVVDMADGRNGSQILAHSDMLVITAAVCKTLPEVCNVVRT